MELDRLQHLAKLARLALRDDELEALAQHMDKIVQAVSTLQDINTDDVEVFNHDDAFAEAEQGPRRLRPDLVTPSLSAEQALANAPKQGPQGFAVPAIHD